MDTDKVLHLLSLLDDRLEDVSTAIAPLLNAPLTENASKLPVVDKAKLYILQVYAIESLLHSYLRLNNITVKDHPIMKELARVKQYIDKIKAAEDNAARQAGAGLHLDKEAAGRFIKAALAGNDRLDRLEQEKKKKSEEEEAQKQQEEQQQQQQPAPEDGEESSEQSSVKETKEKKKSKSKSKSKSKGKSKSKA